MVVSKNVNNIVSVIVPCYNQASFLSETLASVSHQSYANWECIIVNDGSVDDTDFVAAEWCRRDNRISYLKRENGGLPSARNAGIKNSAGKYILCLDADDIIHKKYLELATQAYFRDENLSLVYCMAEKFGFSNEPWELPPYDFKTLLLNNIIFCSALYKKEDWLRAGQYDENLKNGWEDWSFWVKLLNKQSKVYKIPEVLFYYRTKESSMLNTMEPKHKEEVRWFIFKNQIEKYQQIFASPIYYIDVYDELWRKVAEIEKENFRMKEKLTQLEALTKK